MIKGMQLASRVGRRELPPIKLRLWSWVQPPCFPLNSLLYRALIIILLQLSDS